MSNFIVECEKHTSEHIQHTQRDISTYISDLQIILFVFLSPSSCKQFKYLEKDEFKDLKNLRRIRLDQNQLSVVVDDLFNRQKSLEFLGELLRL
jgi:hypothetical protein